MQFLPYLLAASCGKAIHWRIIPNDIQQDKHTFALGVLPLAPGLASHFTFFGNDSSVFTQRNLILKSPRRAVLKTVDCFFVYQKIPRALIITRVSVRACARARARVCVCAPTKRIVCFLYLLFYAILRTLDQGTDDGEWTTKNPYENKNKTIQYTGPSGLVKWQRPN